MTDVRVTVYTNDGCVRCGAAMRRLDAEGIPYEVVNCSTDSEGAERLKRAGIFSVPTFGYGGRLHESIAALPEIIRLHKEAST